jgi:hypothetical protein
VGQQKKNGNLERIILNIPNCLLISGGCQQDNPSLKMDDSITNESPTIYETLESFYTHKMLFV